MHRTFFALALGLLGGAAIPSLAVAQSDALAQAKSFEVEETIGGRDHITVQVIRPDKVRIVISNAKGMMGMFVGDKTVGREYNAGSNTWVTMPPSRDGSYRTVLADLAALAILKAGGKLPEVPGAELTSVHETLNGKDTVRQTLLFPPQTSPTGESYRQELKLWSDPATGLPVRRAQAVVGAKGESIFQDLTFDNVRINPSLKITWNPPAGAKEDPGIVFLKSGRMAPDFALVDNQGKTVHLSDYRGSVVILDFWATWCGPCQRAMPHLEEVYQSTKDKGVVVLAVCVWDAKPEYDQWVAKKSATYHFQTLFDPAGRGKTSIASNLYEVKGIPTQYVIGKDGKVVAGYIPGASDSDPVVDALKRAGIPYSAKP